MVVNEDLDQVVDLVAAIIEDRRRR
jgi:hypothetical protein